MPKYKQIRSNQTDYRGMFLSQEERKRILLGDNIPGAYAVPGSEGVPNGTDDLHDNVTIEASLVEPSGEEASPSGTPSHMMAFDLEVQGQQQQIQRQTEVIQSQDRRMIQLQQLLERLNESAIPQLPLPVLEATLVDTNHSQEVVTDVGVQNARCIQPSLREAAVPVQDNQVPSDQWEQQHELINSQNEIIRAQSERLQLLEELVARQRRLAPPQPQDEGESVLIPRGTNPRGDHESNDRVCTKKRYGISLIVFLVLIGIIVGVLFSIVGTSEKGESGDGNYTVPDEVIDGTNTSSTLTSLDELIWIPMGRDITNNSVIDEMREMALSADGKILAIGSLFNDERLGRVQVFHFENHHWVPMGQELSLAGERDHYGWSVALATPVVGRTILAASARAYFADDKENLRGLVQVFQYDSHGRLWQQLGGNIVGMDHELFGDSIDLSADGSMMAVGAPGQPGYMNDRGKLRVYRYDSISDRWDVFGNQENMVGDIAVHPNNTRNSELGSSVALSEDGSIVAGTTRFNDQTGYQTGAIHIFQYQSNTKKWVPLGPPIQGAAEGDRLGWRVAISGDGKVVVGSGSKHVVVYGYYDVANEWFQLGQKLKSDNPKDNIGFSLDISSDGKVLAASAWGRVWVYWYNAEMNTWMPLGKHGEFTGDTENDRFGRSVRLSADGRILACSALGVVGNTSSGYVRVYRGV